MIDLAEAIEPALSLAREKLAQAQKAPAEVWMRRCPMRVRRSRRVARCWCCIVRRCARSTTPGRVLESRMRELDGAARVVELEGVRFCVGDPEQVVLCLQALLGSVELYEDSTLVVELFEEEEVPQISLSLDGPGLVPSRLRVGGLLPFGLDELEVRVDHRHARRPY